MRRPAPGAGLLLAAVAGSALFGCVRGRAEDWKAALDAEARDAVAAVRLDDEESIDRVAAVRSTPQGRRAAAEALRSGAKGPARWAAVWVRVSSESDPAVLRSWLEEDDASIRAMAAAGLTARGEVAGLEALVRLLGVEESLKGSRPKVSVRAFASATLSRFTGAAATTAWGPWLEQHREKLKFDRALGVWRAS